VRRGTPSSFRECKVVRERIYFGDPWEPPEWRAQGSSSSTRAADAADTQGGWSRPPRVRIAPPPLQERAIVAGPVQAPVPAASVSRRRP